ncbi:Mannuronan synthase [bacterium HR40]|nr:Mannuronan synthase [bacterium HR40]
MHTQIAHETEIHRQHIRLRIPITVEIDGTSYVADDWSLGGFGVANGIAGRQPGDRFPVRMFFPFEDFEIVLHADCQLVYVTPDHSRFGCRFLGLTAGQAELFRYLIEAYLSGEIVSAGDVLVAANRRTGAQLRRLAAVDEEEPGLGGRLRRWFGHGLLVAAALGLVALVVLGVRERYFVVRTSDAVVWVPMVELRAPFAGRVEALPRKPVFAAGDPVARVVAADGSEATLVSPCECALLQWITVPGTYAQPAEAVVTLAAADQPLLIRAQLPVDRARRLAIGQRAEIWLPGSPEPLLAQVEKLDFKPDLAGLVRNGPDAGESRKAQIYLRPDRPLAFDLLGSLVEVRIP